MTRRTYKKGDHLVVCDISGQTYYASECRMTWDGKYVYKDNWEPRHPQDFVRSKTDNQSVPISRPRQEDQFIEVPYFTGYLILEDWNGVPPVNYLTQENDKRIIW
jgi:hypothetical protein